MSKRAFSIWIGVLVAVSLIALVILYAALEKIRDAVAPQRSERTHQSTTAGAYGQRANLSEVFPVQGSPPTSTPRTGLPPALMCQ